MKKFLLFLAVCVISSCTPTPTRFGASGGTPSPINPASWSVPAWFVDPGNSSTNASDSNNCTTSGTPCLTKAQIFQRWGTNSPNLSTTVTITYLSADTTGTDPGIFTPNFYPGGILVNTASLPAASFTGTLLAVTAKSASGNQALRSTFTVTTGAVAVNMLLVNTTRGNSRAFAQRNTGGGLWQISQPLTPYSGTGTPANTEVDTWANGDSINGYALLNVNLAVVGGNTVQAQAGFAGPQNIVSNMTVWDSQATDDPFLLSGTAETALVESVVTRAFTYAAAPGPLRTQVSNVSINIISFSLPTSGFSSAPFISGGILNGFTSLDSVVFQKDTIIVSSNSVCNNCTFNSSVCIDSGTLKFIGQSSAVSGVILYGGGTINVGGGVFGYVSTAASTFPLTGGLQLNGVATGYSNSTTAGVTTIHGGITLNPTNLDAAAGAAGFGGYAYGGGATLIKGTVQP